MKNGKCEAEDIKLLEELWESCKPACYDLSVFDLHMRLTMHEAVSLFAIIQKISKMIVGAEGKP